MKEEKNFRKEGMLNLTQFYNLFYSIINDEAFETGDFLTILLRFWGFWGSFSYKTLLTKKTSKNKQRKTKQNEPSFDAMKEDII